ncbi:unnamed protein product [Gemmata massiliana]|uniref:Lipoprotein n=1 Tax=Gemmata massiliana TaxID=1210884 RepID=A0A6P2CXK4_9BACT|nr:hypothetical protein [Gemmata massiliana]VTR91842.1 unnamed protein product [Gemmata massiliana]
MRRYIALTSVLAALVAAIGCNHVGGKCDCGYNPSDYQISGPTNPYPSAPVPATKPTAPKGGGNE